MRLKFRSSARAAANRLVLLISFMRMAQKNVFALNAAKHFKEDT